DVTFIGDPITSGLLTIGSTYRIVTYVTGDDFSNVGATANGDLVEFVATGDTPADWSHNSVLQEIQKTPVSVNDIADFQVVAHQDDDRLFTWNKGDAAMLVSGGLVQVEVVKAVTAKWLGVVNFKVSPSFVETDYFDSGAQTDVVCFDALINVEPC